MHNTATRRRHRRRAAAGVAALGLLLSGGAALEAQTAPAIGEDAAGAAGAAGPAAPGPTEATESGIIEGATQDEVTDPESGRENERGEKWAKKEKVDVKEEKENEYRLEDKKDYKNETRSSSRRQAVSA